MKYPLTALCFVGALLISVAAVAQKKIKDWPKTGDTLVYEITVGYKQYNFIVKNLKIDNNIVFDWEMTKPNELIGSLVISAHALDTATAQKNYFQDGERFIENRTCIWISKRVYQAIKKKETIRINPGNGPTPLNYKSKQELTVLINGVETKVKTLFAETAAGDRFWILDNKDNPIIVKMYIGFTAVLKEVHR